jgi:hypothetical protein
MQRKRKKQGYIHSDVGTRKEDMQGGKAIVVAAGLLLFVQRVCFAFHLARVIMFVRSTTFRPENTSGD